MTPTRHDDSYDPAIAGAWQATRSDEPSAALDDLIRAAARREVGAGPRSKAMRFRAWLPLAAAATVAVVAFGIVQMAPPEMMSAQVASTRVTPTSPNIAERAAASPSPTTSATKDAGLTDAPPGAQGAASAKIEARATDATSTAGSPQQPRRTSAATWPQTSAAKPRSAAAMHDAPRTPAPAPVAPPAASPAPAPAIQSAPTDAAAPAAMPAAPPAMSPAAAPRATPDRLLRRSEPFPASEAPKRTDGMLGAAPAQASGGATAVDRTTQATGRMAKDAALPPRDARASEADETGSGGTVRADAAQREAASAQPTAKREAGGAAFAQAARVKTASTDVPRMEPAARTLGDWIALLRRLKAEARDEQLTRELIAFRALYKDRANDLLPADLRDLKR